MKSIIIPVFNQHDMTNECIYAVMENTQDCEIIVVDNGSNPPYKPPFTGFAECLIIRNEEIVKQYLQNYHNRQQQSRLPDIVSATH